MVKNILSKLKSVFNTGSSKQPSKQPSKQLLPPETDGEGGHLCMINYHFEDEDYDDDYDPALDNFNIDDVESDYYEN